MATEIKYIVSFQNRMFLSTNGDLIQSGDPNIAYFSTIDLASSSIDSALPNDDYTITTLVIKS